MTLAQTSKDTETARSGMRPLATEDLAAVARMFARTFGQGRVADNGPLMQALSDLYMPRAAQDEGAVSLVNYTDDGVLNGFLGVFTLPYVVEGKSYQAAFCGGHMVDPDRADGLLGPRLLRAVMSGPQDLTVTDTANAVSESMWRRMKARVLPSYSLEWVRVFRAGSFAASSLAKRVSPSMRAVSGQVLSRPVNLIGGKLVSAFGDLEPSQCEEEEITSDKDFAAHLVGFTKHFAGRPDWSRIDLHHMVATAREKPEFGSVTRRLVLRAGTPIGLYHFHSEPSGIGRVLQIAAAPGSEQLVVDRLFLTAHESGLAGLRGRTQPRIFEAMLTRHCQFFHQSSTLVRARDPGLLIPFLTGDAFVNGFAGEQWTGFFGGGL